MKWLRCPRCHASLVAPDERLRCEGCESRYPVYFGIPDLRLMDPLKVGYTSEEEDLALAKELAAVYSSVGYEELVRFCVIRRAIGEPRELINNYILHRLRGPDEAQRVAARIGQTLGITGPNGTIGLDIGCGSGTGMKALLSHTEAVIGIDIMLSELVCACKFLETYSPGRTAVLVAGVAEALPLSPGLCSVIIARDVVEHVKDRILFLQEAERVQAAGGVFLFNTPGRFGWIEPHTRLAGVGFMPRFLQPHYVHWRRSRGYDVYLMSLRELRSLLRRTLRRSNWQVYTRPRVRLDVKGHTWKGQLVRAIPGLGHLINALAAYFSSYEVEVHKPV